MVGNSGQTGYSRKNLHILRFVQVSYQVSCHVSLGCRSRKPLILRKVVTECKKSKVQPARVVCEMRGKLVPQW